MNGWHQVRVRRDENGPRVVTEIVEREPGDRTPGPHDDSGRRPGPVRPEPHRAPARVPATVKPQPAPVRCATCHGTGERTVTTGAGMLVSTTTNGDPGTVSRPSWTRTETCSTCRGLGWVLLAGVEPVAPVPLRMPAVPWFPGGWQPQPWQPQIFC